MLWETIYFFGPGSFYYFLFFIFEQYILGQGDSLPDRLGRETC